MMCCVCLSVVFKCRLISFAERVQSSLEGYDQVPRLKTKTLISAQLLKKVEMPTILKSIFPDHKC